MDSTVSTIFNLFIVAFLLLSNAFCVASEFAMVRVRRTRMEELSKQGNKTADLVLELLKDMDRIVGAAQLGVTISSVALGWVGEATIAGIVEPIFSFLPHVFQGLAVHTFSAIVAFSLITFLHVSLGEQAPKLIALQYTEKITLFIARPTAWMATIFNPLVILLNGFCNLLLKMLHIENPKTTFAHSTEELDMLVDASYKEGVLNETEKEMLHNAFKFSDLTAKEVMIPRTDMICIQNDIGLSELSQFARENQYTRYPVFEEDLDHIKGFLHIKDLYTSSSNEDNFDVNNLIRPILFVPETITLDNIVREFKKRQSQIAIVIDEYGGTAGLVTLEDVFEEIFGEVQDEFDEVEEVDIKEIGENSFEANAMLRLDEMAKFFDLNEEDFEEEDVDTVGGVVLKLLGRVAQLDDSVEWKNMTFQVKEIDGVRITKILIVRHQNIEELSLEKSE
ncbi:HlyC/CorC family transporter [bacterium]|nr:HlyC/CorC family transporter [bacterium]